MENERVDVIPIYRYWWAQNLVYNGFRLVGMRKNHHQEGQIIFFFEDSPELVEELKQMIKEHNEWKNKVYGG